MRVTLKELNAVAANTKHRTVQASYLQSAPTDGMAGHSKVSTSSTSDLMMKLERPERPTKLNYVVCKRTCVGSEIFCVACPQYTK